MRRSGVPRYLSWSVAWVLLGVAPAAAAAALCAVSPGRPTVCTGAYALCSAAACSSASKVTDPAPVAECDCPVANGPALADLERLPGGSCTAPRGQVFALQPSSEPPGKGTMSCPGGAFAQCWNAACTWRPGEKLAHCTCAVCTGAFLTAGGGCDAASCVQQLLVAAPRPAAGGLCR
jgi:hypothetical protein